MTDTQNENIPALPIGKIAIGGFGIGVGSILLFVALWFGLQSVGASQVVSLISAVCIPIVLMTIGLFVLYLRRADDWPRRSRAIEGECPTVVWRRRTNLSSFLRCAILGRTQVHPLRNRRCACVCFLARYASVRVKSLLAQHLWRP